MPKKHNEDHFPAQTKERFQQHTGWSLEHWGLSSCHLTLQWVRRCLLLYIYVQPIFTLCFFGYPSHLFFMARFAVITSAISNGINEVAVMCLHFVWVFALWNVLTLALLGRVGGQSISIEAVLAAVAEEAVGVVDALEALAGVAVAVAHCIGVDVVTACALPAHPYGAASPQGVAEIAVITELARLPWEGSPHKATHAIQCPVRMPTEACHGGIWCTQKYSILNSANNNSLFPRVDIL